MGSRERERNSRCTIQFLRLKTHSRFSSFFIIIFIPSLLAHLTKQCIYFVYMYSIILCPQVTQMQIFPESKVRRREEKMKLWKKRIMNTVINIIVVIISNFVSLLCFHVGVYYYSTLYFFKKKKVMSFYRGVKMIVFSFSALFFITQRIIPLKSSGG